MPGLGRWHLFPLGRACAAALVPPPGRGSEWAPTDVFSAESLVFPIRPAGPCARLEPPPAPWQHCQSPHSHMEPQRDPLSPQEAAQGLGHFPTLAFVPAWAPGCSSRGRCDPKAAPGWPRSLPVLWRLIWVLWGTSSSSSCGAGTQGVAGSCTEESWPCRCPFPSLRWLENSSRCAGKGRARPSFRSCCFSKEFPERRFRPQPCTASAWFTPSLPPALGNSAWDKGAQPGQGVSCLCPALWLRCGTPSPVRHRRCGVNTHRRCPGCARPCSRRGAPCARAPSRPLPGIARANF